MTCVAAECLRVFARASSNARKMLWRVSAESVRVHQLREQDELIPDMTKMSKDFMAKAEKVLTDSQQKEWKELVGKPFEVRMDFGGRGRGRGQDKDKDK